MKLKVVVLWNIVPTKLEAIRSTETSFMRGLHSAISQMMASLITTIVVFYGYCGVNNVIVQYAVSNT
jgi:hypothetical protein